MNFITNLILNQRQTPHLLTHHPILSPVSHYQPPHLTITTSSFHHFTTSPSHHLTISSLHHFTTSPSHPTSTNSPHTNHLINQPPHSLHPLHPLHPLPPTPPTSPHTNHLINHLTNHLTSPTLPSHSLHPLRPQPPNPHQPPTFLIASLITQSISSMSRQTRIIE
jgi:hypothetical protein